MFFDPACIPCIIHQAYNSIKLFTDGDKDIQLKVMKEVCAEIRNINKDYTAPMFSSIIQTLVEKNLGIKNPYKKIKENNLKMAKQFIPYLEKMIESSCNKLEISIRAAIAGNTIDLGANPRFDLEYEINRITSDSIILPGLKRFSEDLTKSSLILFIGDNYEEALFDILLLKQLAGKRVVYAVRSRPILNDITLEDAKNLVIDKICEVIESGSTMGGTDLSAATKEFSDLYKTADMVISKGQGNYETLMNEERPIYFMFKIKCEAISGRCGYPVGKGVLILNQKQSDKT